MALHRHDAAILVPVTLALHTELGLVQFMLHAVEFVDGTMSIQPQVGVMTETRTRPMKRWKRA